MRRDKENIAHCVFHCCHFTITNKEQNKANQSDISGRNIFFSVLQYQLVFFSFHCYPSVRLITDSHSRFTVTLFQCDHGTKVHLHLRSSCIDWWEEGIYGNPTNRSICASEGHKHNVFVSVYTKTLRADPGYQFGNCGLFNALCFFFRRGNSRFFVKAPWLARTLSFGFPFPRRQQGQNTCVASLKRGFSLQVSWEGVFGQTSHWFNFSSKLWPRWTKLRTFGGNGQKFCHFDTKR